MEDEIETIIRTPCPTVPSPSFVPLEREAERKETGRLPLDLHSGWPLLASHRERGDATGKSVCRRVCQMYARDRIGIREGEEKHGKRARRLRKREG